MRQPITSISAGSRRPASAAEQEINDRRLVGLAKPNRLCLKAPSFDRKALRNVGGRSSVVEHNLAKVGVEGSNPFARSIFNKIVTDHLPVGRHFAAVR